MTVIAWDGRLLVADSRISAGDQIITDDGEKLHHLTHPVRGPMIAGLSGSTRYWAKWLNVIEGQSFGEPVGAGETYQHGQGLFVDRSGTCWEAQTDGTWEEVATYSTQGSGGLLANTVLRDGGDAVEAVRFACRHSMSCGGTIRVYCPASNVIVRLAASAQDRP